MANSHYQVWFAEERTISRLFKWRLYDDRGWIRSDSGRIQFSGRRDTIVCANVTQISLVRQPIPWWSVAFAAGLLIASTSSGFMTFFTWRNPVTIPCMGAFIAFYVLIVGTTKWVEIDYMNEKGEARKAYFLDGSGDGLFGLFGGTRLLYSDLRSVVLPSS